MGRNNMLLLQPMGTFTFFLGCVVVTGEDFLVGTEWATTIESDPVVPVDLSQKDFFGFIERLIGGVAVVGGVNGGGE